MVAALRLTPPPRKPAEKSHIHESAPIINELFVPISYYFGNLLRIRENVCVFLIIYLANNNVLIFQQSCEGGTRKMYR